MNNCSINNVYSCRTIYALISTLNFFADTVLSYSHHTLIRAKIKYIVGHFMTTVIMAARIPCVHGRIMLVMLIDFLIVYTYTLRF